MSTSPAEHYASVLESVASLPPLPATAQQVLSAFGDEFIDADEIADIVREDPAIVARMLGLANSAYYGLAVPVDNIDDAIGRVIGVEISRSVILAIALQRSLDQSRCPAFDSERFWRESLLAAHCCRRIAVRDPEISEQAVRLSYVAGLCHNLGLLALAYLAPEETNAVLAANPGRHVSFADCLQERVGVSHREATWLLARHWGLPEQLTEAYRCRADASAVTGCRLGLILIASTSAVGNLVMQEDQQFDLDHISRQLGVAVAELQSMALPGQRQGAQIDALAKVMT